MQVRGCGTALVTPFHQDGSIDDSALRNLVAWQVESGIDFLVPCGTTGETPTLSREEWLHVIDTTIEVAAGRVPIVAGATSNSTQEAVEKAKEVGARSGVDAILYRFSLLQQADARGSVSALQGDRGGRTQQTDHSLQRAWPHCGESRTCNAGAIGGDSEHRWGEGSQWQHDTGRGNDQRSP